MNVPQRAAFKPWLKRAVVGALLLALAWGACWSVAWARSELSAGNPVQSLPPAGPGFSSYSLLGNALGRQYVRAPVKEIVLAGVKRASESQGGRRYVIAETGARHLGRFAPHATHRAGLSVDIQIPVKASDGRPVSLDSSFWNLWGYCWHLDRAGTVSGLAWEAKAVTVPVFGAVRTCPTMSLPADKHVDFEALAALLESLSSAARERGASIRAAIVAPEYVDDVLRTPAGKRLGATAKTLTQRPTWIRHDDHIHVDFVVPSAATGKPSH